jgi:hypothetical protein
MRDRGPAVERRFRLGQRRLEGAEIADAVRAPRGAQNGAVERNHLAQREVAHLREAAIEFQVLGQDATC